MQRTLPGGAQAFDTVAQNTNVTDAAWVTMTGLYTFTTDVTGLLLYVESTSATASYYIDSFSIVQLAPPPGPPGNTPGADAARSRAARPRAGPRARAARWSPTRPPTPTAARAAC